MKTWVEMRVLAIASFSFVTTLFFASTAKSAALTAEEARAIAEEAYIYFYPLVLMDVTKTVTTNYAPGQKEGMGPAGMFHHIREYPKAEFREVVRPNFDTLYSMAWIDVSAEPSIVSVPDTQGRYYVLPLYDMWTDIFAAPGSRTSGTEAGHFAIVPPNWKGTLPKGVERIEAPTANCWIVVRTQTNGPKDYAAVHKVQDGYRLTPLSQWGKAAKPIAGKVDPSIDSRTAPLTQVNRMSGAKFFAHAAEVLKKNPPHKTDWSILTRIRRLGIVEGQSFDFQKADKVIQEALEAAPAASLKIMQAKAPTLARVANGWQMNTDTMGVYGNFYLKRAIIALVGLGANQPDDAVYPLNVSDSEGKRLDGNSSYVLHFTKEQLPPVGAFWSVTMYDFEGFPVANKLNRFALGDRDPLKYNPDGSLDIYIQSESPSEDKIANWLPAPRGPAGVTMRLYAPKEQVLDGRWNPPPIKRLDSTKSIN